MLCCMIGLSFIGSLFALGSRSRAACLLVAVSVLAVGVTAVVSHAHHHSARADSSGHSLLAKTAAWPICTGTLSVGADRANRAVPTKEKSD